MRTGSPRGLALIIVAGVLGLLAALAMAFTTLAQLERRASRQRLNATKAYLLSRSGLEDAMARMASGQDPEASWNRYGGEDWDADATLGVMEARGDLVHRGALDVWRCPARDAMRPSYAARNNGLPALLNVGGRPRGYTKHLSGDQADLGNHYALRVDRLAGIHVNGGDPSFRSDPQATSDANTDLRRMLGILTEAVGHLEGPAALTREDGWNLVDRRPVTGWRSHEQIQELAFGGDREKLEALQGYLALSAWVDKKVIRPTATEGMLGKVYSWGEIKLGQPGGRGKPRACPRFEEVNGRVVGRAPVDFGWARTRMPVLIALLADLRGIYLDNGGATNYALGDAIGELREVGIPLDWSKPTDPCRIIAQQILTSTTEISDWQQFKVFSAALRTTESVLLSRLEEGGPGLIQARRDLLLAAFNPNSDLNKFNPNLPTWKCVDKMDLLQQSTELSLVPMCIHQVTSVGRVLGSGGRLKACRTLKAGLAAPSVLRLTTQAEFVCEDLGRLDVAGDESLPRLPGFRAQGDLAGRGYITQSRDGSGARTWGHRLNTGSSGLGLQTYPEPYVAQGGTRDVAKMQIKPTDYDGNLQLATVETPDGTYGVLARPGILGMLACYTDGLDLEPTMGQSQATVRLQPDAGHSVTSVGVGESLLDPKSMRLLYPDGCYSERGRAPAYLDRGHANGFHGVISFWVKPSSGVYRAMGSRGKPYLQGSNFLSPPTGSDEDTQQFILVMTPGGASGIFQAFFEANHGSEDNEHQFSAPFPGTSGKGITHWHLVTLAYDLRAPDRNDACKLLAYGLDREWAASSAMDEYTLPTSPSSEPPEDLTVDHWSSRSGTRQAHTLTLGYFQGVPPDTVLNSSCGGGADATFDEFAVYDFGGAEPAADGTITPASAETKMSPQVLAWLRFNEGRYYKGHRYVPVDEYGRRDAKDEAPSWFSGPIHLPAGSRLHKVFWTCWRSDFLPTDFCEIEIVAPNCGEYPWGGDASSSTGGGRRDWDVSRQAWVVNRVLPQVFRLRVLFERKATRIRDFDTPLLESPVLDDITLLYRSPDAGGISSWEAGG